MKKLTVVSIVILAGLFYSCSRPPFKQTVTEVYMTPVKVGTKTPDYEVVSPSKLKLADGVKIKVLKGPNGENNGFVILRANGDVGGFMDCGCGSGSGSCAPADPAGGCTGGCHTSEGTSYGCIISESPDKPPAGLYVIKFRTANSNK